MDLSRAVYSRDLKIVPPNNPIDLQLLKLIDFHLLRWSAQQRLFWRGRRPVVRNYSVQAATAKLSRGRDV